MDAGFTCIYCCFITTTVLLSLFALSMVMDQISPSQKIACIARSDNARPSSEFLMEEMTYHR